MAEKEVHARLKLVGAAFLKQKCIDIVATEVRFRNIRSIADVCALNLKRKEVRIIEVKASKADYKRDKKLFDITKSYFLHCNYFYIMCPCGVILKDEVPKEYGLLYVDKNNNVEVIRNPKKNKTLKTRFDTALKNCVRSITNDLIFKFFRCQDLVSWFKYQ